MQVDLHRNFMTALRQLAEPERASVQRTVSMLHSHGITPGMRYHPVAGFDSISVNMDLRILARKVGERIVLLHVDHHKKAYDWAGRTAMLDTALDACEMVPRSVLLSGSGSQIKAAHVPIPVATLLELQDEDAFLHAVGSLSPEWQEWMLTRYIDEDSDIPPPTDSSLVFVADGPTELEEALYADLPDWRLFLHPNQQMVVQDNSSGAMSITGGPGTGKTAVLLNRLLTQSPKGKDADCSVLLTY